MRRHQESNYKCAFGAGETVKKICPIGDTECRHRGFSDWPYNPSPMVHGSIRAWSNRHHRGAAWQGAVLMVFLDGSRMVKTGPRLTG